MMTNKIFVFLIIIFSFAVLAGSANAAGLNFIADANVILAGNTYVIATGSTAETMSGTGTTALTITLIGGESFTLSSASGYTLVTSPTVAAQVCAGVTNSVTVTALGTTVITPDAAITHCPVVTPTPSPTPIPGGDSSHVIGSSGVAPVTPQGTIGTIIAADGQVICPNGKTLVSNCTVAPVFAPGICPNGMTIASNCTSTQGNTTIEFNPVTGPFSYAFGNLTIKLGSSGSGCSAWQNFLNVHRNAGLVLDGKCGPLTMGAARGWQASSGLVADGLLGPMSRAEANRQAALQ